jgi:hypothetical protein
MDGLAGDKWFKDLPIFIKQISAIHLSTCESRFSGIFILRRYAFLRAGFASTVLFFAEIKVIGNMPLFS